MKRRFNDLRKMSSQENSSFVLDRSAEETEGTYAFTVLVHRELNTPINFVTGLGADVKN